MTDNSIDESTSSPSKDISSINEHPSSSPPTPPSSPSKSHSSVTDKFDSLASREQTPHQEITKVNIHVATETDIDEKKIDIDNDGCYTNKGFDDGGSVSSLQDSVLASVDQESIASTAMRTDGTGSYTNPAFEYDASVTRQDSGVGHETQMYRPLKRTGEFVLKLIHFCASIKCNSLWK